MVKSLHNRIYYEYEQILTISKNRTLSVEDILEVCKSLNSTQHISVYNLILTTQNRVLNLSLKGATYRVCNTACARRITRCVYKTNIRRIRLFCDVTAVLKECCQTRCFKIQSNFSLETVMILWNGPGQSSLSMKH